MSHGGFISAVSEVWLRALIIEVQYAVICISPQMHVNDQCPSRLPYKDRLPAVILALTQILSYLRRLIALPLERAPQTNNANRCWPSETKYMRLAYIGHSLPIHCLLHCHLIPIPVTLLAIKSEPLFPMEPTLWSCDNPDEGSRTWDEACRRCLSHLSLTISWRQVVLHFCQVVHCSLTK